MAQTAYPFDSGSGANVSEAQWWRMGQIWAPDGVLSTLGGAWLGELLPFGDASGMVAKISAGHAWIKGVYFENDALWTSPALGASHATLDRIDRIVIRIDWGGFTGTLVVVPGVAAVSPAPPAIALNPGSVYDMTLCQVRVRAATTTILAGDVTDERVFTDLQTRIPPGAMFDWCTAVAPPGYLLCGGQAVSRIRYARLFAVLGTTFGAGDGVLTFNVPDLRGCVGVGLDNMAGTAAGRVPSASAINGTIGGASTHTMTPSELVNHVHNLSVGPVLSDTASSDHQHPVNPPTTNSTGESVQHQHTVDPPNATTGTESILHHHNVNPPSVASGGTSANHDHAVPGGSGTTGTDLAGHDHAIALSGTTSGGSAHHHGSGIGYFGGTGATISAPGVGGTGPEMQTSNDTPAHGHNWSGTGTSGGVNAPHDHSFSFGGGTSGFMSVDHGHAVDIGPFNSDDNTPGHTHDINIASFASGVDANDHVHAVDIAPFNCGGMTLNHQHNFTISGSTGGTGSTTPFSTMPPYLIVGKIIKV
jgi:microcystin-dependent protein